MSSSQPRYRYGSNNAEEEQTDEFLAKLTGSNKKEAPPADGKKSRESQPVVGRSVNYSTLSDGRELPPKTSAVVAAYFLGGVSVLLFLASAGMLGFLAIRERPLASLWPLAFYGAIALCGTGLLGGVCGFAGTLCRSNVLKSLCMFFVILFAVGCGVCGAVIALYDTNNLHIASSWNELVRTDPQTACTFMNSYECTGWSTSCVATAEPQAPTQLPTELPTSSPVSEFDWTRGRKAAVGIVDSEEVTLPQPHEFYPGLLDRVEDKGSFSSDGGFPSGTSGPTAAPTAVPAFTSGPTAAPAGGASTTTAVPGAASTTTTVAPGAASTTTTVAPGAASTTTAAPPSPVPPTPPPPTPVPTTTVAPPTPAPTLSPQCTAACSPALFFTEPCATSFHSSLSGHVAIGFGVAGGLAVLSIIAAIAAYKSRSVIIDTRDASDFF